MISKTQTGRKALKGKNKTGAQSAAGHYRCLGRAGITRGRYERHVETHDKNKKIGHKSSLKQEAKLSGMLLFNHNTHLLQH